MTSYRSILFVFCLSFCGCGDVILGSDPPNTPEANFEHLWRDYDRYYALFDAKGVNWQMLYDQYRPQVTAQTNERELFAILSAMLTPLNDGHVSLTAPFARFQSNQDSRVPDGFNTNRVRMHYLENRGYQTGGNRFLYGRLEGNIGYIYIRSFSGGGLTGSAANWVYDIDIVLEDIVHDKK